MLKYVSLFFVILAGDIVGHYIYKFLDKNKQQ